MIGEAELETCKTGVMIINVSRGGVIDEDALARAISSGKVGGAGLDVFEEEPLTSSPLFGLDTVVLTPHVAGQTTEAQDKAGVIAAEQVLLALRGDFVPNAVNLEAGAELPDFLRPFLGLGRKLGRLAAALAGEGVGAIDVSYQGQIAEEDTRVVTLAENHEYDAPAERAADPAGDHHVREAVPIHVTRPGDHRSRPARQRTATRTAPGWQRHRTIDPEAEQAELSKAHAAVLLATEHDICRPGVAPAARVGERCAYDHVPAAVAVHVTRTRD